MIVLLVLASVAAPGLGELFTSMAHLERALHTERDIATEIRNYIYEEEKRLLKLKQLADEFQNHSANALKDPELYMSNPVNAYLFAKHFTLDWDSDIDVIIKNNSRHEWLHTKIEKMREYLPTYDDLTGSVNGFFRLQDTYKLETADLARGNVSGFASPELSAWDCFELGRMASTNMDYYHAVMWLEEALAKVKELEDDDVIAVNILDFLAFSQYKQGNIRRALTLTDKMLKLTPEHERAQSNREYYEHVLREEDVNSTRGHDGEVINKRQLEGYHSEQEFADYEALCRNENILPNKYQHNLFCRYRTNNHPSLILSPAKEEVLYLKNPFLSVYHDSITDREIKLIQELAIPRLGRAMVVNGTWVNRAFRVTKICWLSEYDSPEIARIHRRIAAMTGLSLDTAEDLQVANYGVGGQYEPHFDHATKTDELASLEDHGNGQRIATLMFYLTDVQAGGATVFPHLGLKVFPEKGKAIFWYNLHKNGQGISSTLHAACPVLIGSKWVSNKWIHEHGQEFRRPCGLQESE